MDLLKICTICFERVSETPGVTTELVESKEVWEKITSCFQLSLPSNQSSFLPCSFCRKCVEDLNNAYKFRTKCETIHERYRDYCENLNKNKMFTDESALNVCEEITDDHSEINEDKTFETEVVLTKNEEIFVCNICNKVLKTKKSLTKHIISMHEKRNHPGKVTGFGSARQYHCTACAYSTPHSQTLINHMRRHNGERPFKCECGKNFTQASSLAAHQKTHSSTTYFTCTECGKQFKHAFSLKTHMQVHNSASFSCHICKKILKSNRSLTSHLRRHYKIYNYSCEECGDTFVTSAELINHKMKHNIKKNIACHVCDYRTYSRKNLRVHLKRHAGEKEFLCVFCEKGFLTEGNLRRHTRVHTREKPFSCQTCTQRFAHSSSLNNHMLTFHGVKYKWGEQKLKQSVKLIKTEKDVNLV